MKAPDTHLKSAGRWGTYLAGLALLVGVIAFTIKLLPHSPAASQLPGGDTPFVTSPPSALPGQTQVQTTDPIPMLSLQSSPGDIRQRILHSHTTWQSLWTEAQIVVYAPDGSNQSPQSQQVQVWIRQPGMVRLLSGPAGGDPGFLWISDGEKLRDGEEVPDAIRLGSFSAPDKASGTIYPHPMIGFMPTPLSELLFPSGLAQRMGSYRTTGTETIAGREAVVVEWFNQYAVLADRFWVDARTGLLLRRQHYNKGGGERITQDISLTAIHYDLDFPPQTFDRLAPFPSAFAHSPQDLPTAPLSTSAPPSNQTEALPDTGEVYLLLNRNSVVGLVSFPAACLVADQPCPRPEAVPGFPDPSTFFGGYARWSPYGQQIAFTGDVDGDPWLFDRLTNEWKKLVTPLADPLWSPDGEWLAGSPPVPGNATSNPLLLVKADGSEVRTILEEVPGFKSSVGWLDENRIAFLQVLDNEFPSLHDRVRVVDLQSYELSTLVDIHHDDWYSRPALSPERDRLVYGVPEGDGFQIHVVKVSGASSITFPFAVSGGVDWSPDGEWLSVQAALGFSCEIYLVRPDGSQAHKVFNGDGGGACSFTWSPDGRYLLAPAFAQNPTRPRLYLVSIPDGKSRLVEMPDVGIAFEWPSPFWLP